jgi:hypothetical protein
MVNALAALFALITLPLWFAPLIMATDFCWWLAAKMVGWAHRKFAWGEPA